MNQRVKNIAVMTLKASLVVGLLGWLLYSGKIDLVELSKLVREPNLLIAAFLFWLIAYVGLGTYRWKTLLTGLGFSLAWPRALRLQMIGLFFNTVMPGAIGGDIIKLVYVVRDNPGRSKAQAMMSALVDRIIGLSGAFLIGWIFLLPHIMPILNIHGLRPVLLFMLILTLGLLVFFAAALWPYPGQDPLMRLLHWNVPGFTLLRHLYAALRSYQHNRRAIFISIGAAAVIQGLSLWLFYYLTCHVLDFKPDITRIASIFPLGQLTMALPIAPGGLGIGHVAFEKLFGMIGLEHGANVFNLFVISQLSFNLIGFLPYLNVRASSNFIESELSSQA